MPFKPFSRKKKTRLAASDDRPSAHGTTVVVSDPACHIDSHDDITMSAIQTSLALLKEGSSLATKFPFIAPIAGLLLQALTMRDALKQYKGECEIVMGKLARIAGIIVDVCKKYNLSEEELPTTLRNILSSLQRTRELDRIERVLKKCSKRKGIKGILLRKDLLTRVKQCDVELSNVLQAFQAELGLDIRFALIVDRREARVTAVTGPIEATSPIPQNTNAAQIFWGMKGALDTLWHAGLNAQEPIDPEGPLPLRALLASRPVLVSVSSYAMLALLDMAAMALIPLVWATPVEFGGLNLNPTTIGLWMSAYGCLNGLVQFTLFPRVVARLGPGRVFLTSIAAYVVIYTMFPFENLAARAKSTAVWLLVVLQLASICITNMGFNSVFMFIAAAAPNKRSLGATNGLAQTVVAVQRMVAPAAAASLFAFSLANDILGGNFTYVVLLTVVCFGLGVAAQLPRHTWRHGEGK
ncbi:hypothetical protein EDB85DRAFT_2142737 [Lactarius pseudohatsudake]|nr:hypothetical protein EDB85DRAFT_2142737 [Lactarius pseudohatsudake]